MVSTLALRIAARYLQATEFNSPEALRDYLKEHPQADKSKHTVKKPEKDAPKHEEGEHEEHEEGPRKTFKERLDSLSTKAKSFLSNVPSEVKKFISHDAHRRHKLHAMHKVVESLPARVYTNAKKAIKHELHEFKTAGHGIKAVLKGEKMTAGQKRALKTVAFDVALTVATVAVTSGLGTGGLTVGLKGLASKSAHSFATALAKKLALKALSHGLGNLTTVEELGHFGHGVVKTVGRFLSASEGEKEEANMDDIMTVFVMKLVADEIDNLDPDTLAEALEEAAEEVEKE